MNAFKILILTAALPALHACRNNDTHSGDNTAADAHHHEEAAGVVSLTKEQMNAVHVELGSVAQKNLGKSIKVTGKLEVPAQNKAAVTSLYEGVLQTLLVHPGTEVRKGQVIARVSNTNLAGIQQSLVAVNAQLKLAELEYSRQKELVAGNAAPLKNLQKAEAERSGLRAQQAALKNQLSTLGISPASVNVGNISSTITLTAPISGTISDIHAQIGSKVDMSTPVATIVNNAQLHLDLFVYEKDLPFIAKGQTIHFTLTNNPGKEYDATIFSIGTAFADATKAVPVHAEVQGDKTGLIEGMSVTAIISIGTVTAPAIPTEAIVTSAGKDYIFVLTHKRPEADHHEEAMHKEKETPPDEVISFERVQVIKGATDLGFTEIQPVTPLPAGVQIVCKGAFFVMAKMTNTGAHEH